MKIQVFLCFALAFGLAIVRAEEYEDTYSDQSENAKHVQSDEEALAKAPASETIVEDEKTKSLAEIDEDQHQKKLGFCHWGVAKWYKPGYQIRCSCMKCTCRRGGKWDCAYHFAYCPYYYCGNQIYNPLKQVCCCGKTYTKNAHNRCCGYFYYDYRYSKCCNYYSVKSKKANCPRSKI